jgi:hypothetical protein
MTLQAATGRIELVVADTPPSFNKTRYMPWYKSGPITRRWIEAFEEQLVAAGMPRATRVKARAELTFLRNARRDGVNFETPVSKAFGDALTGSRHKTPLVQNGKLVLHEKTRKPKFVPYWPDGRFIPDDDPAHFRFAGVRFLKGPVQQTRVILRWWIDPVTST